MFIRGKLITNDVRNEIRYQLLELFDFCTKPSNQPDDINKDCIISNKANNDKAKLTIYGIIDKFQIKFSDKKGKYYELGDIIRSVDRGIVEQIKNRIEKNVIPENIEASMNTIKSRNKDSYLSGAKNFFFPSSREINESDLYTQSYMSVLERAYIFDIIEGTINQFDAIDTSNPFDMISDTMRLFYSYLRQMPFIALIIVILFLGYTIFMVISAGAGLSIGGIAKTIAMQHPAYFTAKSMTESITNK